MDKQDVKDLAAVRATRDIVRLIGLDIDWLLKHGRETEAVPLRDLQSKYVASLEAIGA